MIVKKARMFSGVRQYNKFDIAQGQLETAIRLFLVEGCDVFSAVTLAGAAGEILSQLVIKAGKEPFIDKAIKLQDVRGLAESTPSRAQFGRHIHEILCINELKHHDRSTDQFVVFDVEEAALAAILKAIADYKTLTGDVTGAMKALLAWSYQNLDSKRIIEEFGKAPHKEKTIFSEQG